MGKITITSKRRGATGTASPSADPKDREAYLMRAAELLREDFRAAGSDIPPVRLSVGFPKRGGKSAIGSCWKREASKDGAFQIFISPVLEDSIEALAALAHELCHACTDCTGHGSDFGRIARAIGLEGKLTATYAGPKLTARLNALIEGELGKYPHAALTPEQSGVKKQGTRLVKCVCEESGYTVRTTRQWLVQYGPPISPASKKPMKVEGVDALEGGAE
ncbi:SprT-like domain-containing protein [Geminisphaera colitermitum]|uniref:SprT-like domain-containing protein n=1 Tax=Geminisphaera colitermitum TaxID=1148786 RepID=UPI000158D0F7|nr:SprT-like domain-containing protein [Geminisphaera colitermitum]